MMKHSDFDAVFVDSFDRCQQKDYERICSGEYRKNINLWSWKNDSAQAEFAVLSAGKDIGAVSVASTDLVCGSAALPSSLVKLSFIRDVRAYTGHAGWYANNPFNKMPRGEREYYPEVIYSDKPVPLAKNSLQTVWVQVCIPEYAAPGVYHASIAVSAENSSETVTLDYTVEVLDIMMPSAEDYLFDVEYWSHPYNVAYYYNVEPFSQEHLDILRQHMLLYKNLGGHAITASIVQEAWGGQTYGFNRAVHYPSMIKWSRLADGEWKFDYSCFDKWVQLNRELGIADKIICYSMMPWKNVVRYYDEAAKKERKIKVNPAAKKNYSQIWKPFLSDFIRHLDEKGWFDFVYIGFDERRNMETALDLISEVKNKDGHSLKISASFNDFKHNAAVFNRLNYASVGLDQIRANIEDFKEQVRLRRSNGRETTLYTATDHVPNSFTKSIPVESYWSILFSGSLNTTGFLRWAYDAWVENPLEESTHWSFPAGDCFLVYPSFRDDENRESKCTLRLAKLDEGVRDVNKLYIMREKSPQAAAAVEALFSSVKGAKEEDYEFYTMSKTNLWGRTAKWLTENGKRKMLTDMHEIRQKIYEISKQYCTQLQER